MYYVQERVTTHCAAGMLAPYGMLAHTCCSEIPHFKTTQSVINGGAVHIESRRLADGSWADGEGVGVLACSFKNNTSMLNGGALHYDGSYGQNKEELFVRGTVFDGNNGSSGGALSTWGLSRLYLNESTIKQNIAFFGRGGGIYTYGQ